MWRDNDRGDWPIKPANIFNILSLSLSDIYIKKKKEIKKILKWN